MAAAGAAGLSVRAEPPARYTARMTAKNVPAKNVPAPSATPRLAAAALIALSLLLAGCGNKGPLVLPTASSEAMDAPADEAPDALDPADVDDGTDADGDETGDDTDADAVPDDVDPAVEPSRGAR